MTELERFAAALLSQWRAEGGADGGPIAVSALLTKVFPYRVARRTLGIDVSEDYEALVLRLLSEEDDLVRVDPVDAADMAKATISSKLPDLDVLQLLRAATVTLTSRTIGRLDGVLPMPVVREEKEGSQWAEAAPVQAESPEPAAPSPMPEAPVAPEPPEPETRDHPDVIPIRIEREPARQESPAEPPPAFLTTVTFTPPADERCWSCTELLPPERQVKFCPFCGADQRQPACPACGASVERRWKHCPDCGTRINA